MAYMVNGLIAQFTNSVSQHRLAALARLEHRGEIDLHHDGIHHEEQADRDRDGDHRRAVDEDGHPIQRLRQSRRQLAQHNSRRNAQRTHTVRYFSKKPIPLPAGAGLVSEVIVCHFLSLKQE